VSIEFPEGLLIIEEENFLCELTSFPALPSTLRFIGPSAMSTNNVEVSEVVIPKAVRYIGFSGLGMVDLFEEQTNERTYILEGRSSDDMFAEGWEYLNRDLQGHQYGKKVFKDE